MIQLSNVSLHFGARTLFEKVTLSINQGEKVGLVGRNGSGKSTLLRLLSGEMRPSGGQIDIPSAYSTGYLRQSVDFDESLSPRSICESAFRDVTVLERELEDVQNALEKSVEADEQMRLSGKLGNIIEKLQLIGVVHVQEDIEKVLKGIGFAPSQIDQPVSALSGGWKMRVELARLLLSNPDLLLLDEPTNHLDIESIIWFEDYIKGFAGTVLIVSHDQHVLNYATERTIEISLGQLRDYPFSYRKAMELKEEQLTHLLAAQANQQREIAHKERLINKFKAKAGKAKFAKSLRSELNRMEKIEVDEASEKEMRLRFKPGARVGRVVYKTDALAKSYGEKHVFSGLSAVIERGEKVAFVGQNGQGKTTLARILAQEIESTGGSIEYGHNIQLNYYAQDQTEQLDGKKTVLQTLQMHAPQETDGRIRSILGSVLFEGDEVTKKVSVLSGGERARLSFACMAVHPSNVLILDEPTNHLDIASKEILKEALLQFEGTLIVVSHDMHFLEGLASHILEFRQGRVQKHLYGIEEFLTRRRLEDLRMLEVSDKPEAPEQAAKPAAENDSKANRRLKHEIKQVEQRIERLDKKKEKLTRRMSEDGFYSDPGHKELLDEFGQIEKQLESAHDEWERLIDRL